MTNQKNDQPEKERYWLTPEEFGALLKLIVFPFAVFYVFIRDNIDFFENLIPPALAYCCLFINIIAIFTVIGIIGFRYISNRRR